MSRASWYITLDFDGVALFRAGVDGPYTVDQLGLAEVDGVDVRPLQMLSSPVTTASYSHSDFERPSPIRLTGSGSDVGVELDGDDLFDLLRVTLGVDIDSAGSYSWSAVLADSVGAEVTVAAGDSTLSSGSQGVILNFPGERIGAHGVNGPYVVKDFFFHRGSTALEVPRAYRTSAYEVAQFAGSRKQLYIKGTFVYDDSLLGANQSIPCLLVTAYDTKDRCSGCDSTALDSLASATTADDGSGHFLIGPIRNEDLNDDGGLLDIVVKVYYQSDLYCFGGFYGWYVTLVDSLGKRGAYSSTLYPDVSQDTLDVGELHPTAYADRGALHLCKTLDATAWEGVLNSSDPVTGVTVCWSPGYSHDPYEKGTGYDPSSATLYVDGRMDSSTYSPDEWDDPVVLRAFAHHIAKNLNGLADGQSQYLPCPGGMADSLAWNEGFGLFYSSYIQRLRGLDSAYVDVGVDPSGVRSEFHVDLETGCVNPTCPSGCPNSAGPDNEVAVAGALWDLYDGLNDNQDGDAFGDSLTDGGNAVLYRVYSGRPIRTVQGFMDYYIASTAPRDQNFRRNWLVRQVFYEHGIGYDLTAVDQTPLAPRVLTLLPARPNPFNPRTEIHFGLPVNGKVRLTVFDVRGRRVRVLLDRDMPVGYHKVTWDGLSDDGVQVASGVYYCRLDTATGHRAIKLVIAR
jgi:hypothetical protein